MQFPFFIALTLAFCLQTPLIAEQKVVSGSVLLLQKSQPNQQTLLNTLKTNWKLKTDSVTTADKTLVFSTSGGITVMVAYLDYTVAPDELGAAARLSWLYKTAYKECAPHQAQAVVSVIGPANRVMDLYKVYTQTTAALLESSQSAGVFMQAQYLIHSKDYFIGAARNMLQNQTIPAYLWVYFGRPGGGNGFTFGMEEFGLAEMEIVNSTQAEPDVHAMLYDATVSVIKYNAKLKNGDSITTEDGSTVKVQLGKSTHLENKQVAKLIF